LSETLRVAINHSTGDLASTVSVVNTPEAKAELARATHAVAVDMESGAVGEVAASAGVPFLVLRVIADPQALAIPPAALAGSDEFGRPIWPALASALFQRPRDGLALLRVAMHVRTALASLRRVAVVLGSELEHRDPGWRP
jgi:adenosylhomocysteine nucleosidase